MSDEIRVPPKVRHYINLNVYEAAKIRIRKMLYLFDNLIICFSGGKDSLVTLHLVEEVCREEGFTGKIKVIFRDEELIPDDVINFVQEYYNSGLYDFRYYCLQLKGEKFILGKNEQYIQWDKNRAHIRQKPAYAICDDDNIYDQYSTDKFITKDMRGKSCLVTGIRADESLIRLQSICMKKNESYYAESGTKGVMIGKPIYDWSEKDIFKYLMDKKIPYCKTYDVQLFNQENLRVATPLHSEASKRIFKVKTRYPAFWEQLVSLFPEIELQCRYYKELSKGNMIAKYPLGIEGIRQYIDENLDEANKEKAFDVLKNAATIRRNNIEKRPGNYGGYPWLYVFKQIVNGNYKRQMQPRNKCTKAEIDYENQIKNKL